jgi:hypothetical protein
VARHHVYQPHVLASRMYHLSPAWSRIRTYYIAPVPIPYTSCYPTCFRVTPLTPCNSLLLLPCLRLPLGTTHTLLYSHLTLHLEPTARGSNPHLHLTSLNFPSCLSKSRPSTPKRQSSACQKPQQPRDKDGKFLPKSRPPPSSSSSRVSFSP